jgi:hypothetical protein
MTDLGRPTGTTVVLGLLFGLAYIPMVVSLGYLLGRAMAFRVTACVFILVYALFLARWGKARAGAILFPVVVLLGCAFWVRSGNDFVLLAMAILAWIRSGVCFQGSLLRSAVLEFALCFGGGVLVNLFEPRSPVAWALGIWMFFLIQSLYFVFSGGREAASRAVPLMDPFEAARRQAERILSTVRD